MTDESKILKKYLLSMELRDSRAKFIANICEIHRVTTPALLNFILLHPPGDIKNKFCSLGMRDEYEWDYLVWFLEQFNPTTAKR